MDKEKLKKKEIELIEREKVISKKIKEKQGLKKMPFKKVDMSVFTFVVLIFTTLILISSIISLFLNPEDAWKSTLIFNIAESLLMIGLIAVPTFANRVTRRRIPITIEVIWVVFCVGSIICGEIMDFYGRIGWWDSLLHASSGVLLGVLGYLIINTFNEHDGVKFRFSPLFVAIWVVCFAVAVGAVWEIFEFCCDGLFGANMQQYKEISSTFNDSELLKGHDAIRDTIKDMSLALAGSIVLAVVGYFQMKHDKKSIADAYLEVDERLAKKEEKE